jgi:transposase
MLGRKERDQLELFITGSLRQLVPDDHILARVDRVLDLTWLRDEVADLYSADNGRPGIDPEAAVRLMLAGFLLGLVHDRRLMREAQVNLAIRWFVGYGLHEALPDHSSLTRIRQRWGAERFRRIFQRTVKACVAARIAIGEVVHNRRLPDPRRRQLGEPRGASRRPGRSREPNAGPGRGEAGPPDGKVQEGLADGPGRHHGDERPQPAPGADL